LVKSGVLPAEAAARALAATHDGDVASAALRLGLASEGALVRVLAELHGCPGVDLSRSVVPTANLDVVAHGFCRQRRILPVSVGKAELVLAMADPEDYALADELRFVTGRKVLRYTAVPAAIERVIDGLVREKQRFAPSWRGAEAPSLPDPSAAWVGVVHPARQQTEGIELPEASATFELVPVSDQLETPFAAPSPARRVRPPEHEPVQAARAQEAAATTVRLEGIGAGKLALVADASGEAREELAALVGKLGCTVLQAANGKAALDIVREARPDLVLLEAMLPMVQGFEVCRAIKGDPVLRPTQVVLTSGVHRGTVAADAQIAFGADAFLEKPFRRDEVVRVAKVLLLGGAPDPTDQAKREAAREAWRAGVAALRDGQLEEATVHLRDACAKDDLSAEAHYYLGHALAKQGLLFEAAAAYGRSSELRPDVDAAHQFLAQTYEQLGFQKSAREAWARAIESCRDEARRKAMQARLMTLLGL
ncbi:MAG TPA: response regulator, partial [Anaeromyxobacteraceae bacterium]|nr:response regulator [Anaeromyxobacteraceae bacterium]